MTQLIESRSNISIVSQGNPPTHYCMIGIDQADYNKELSDYFRRCYETGDTSLCDLALCCDNGVHVTVHSILVAIHSPFFNGKLKNMRAAHLTPDAIDIGELTSLREIQPLVQVIVQFMYCSQCQLPKSELLRLLHLSIELKFVKLTTLLCDTVLTAALQPTVDDEFIVLALNLAGDLQLTSTFIDQLAQLAKDRINHLYNDHTLVRLASATTLINIQSAIQSVDFERVCDLLALWLYVRRQIPEVNKWKSQLYDTLPHKIRQSIEARLNKHQIWSIGYLPIAQPSNIYTQPPANNYKGILHNSDVTAFSIATSVSCADSDQTCNLSSSSDLVTPKEAMSFVSINRFHPIELPKMIAGGKVKQRFEIDGNQRNFIFYPQKDVDNIMAKQ